MGSTIAHFLNAEPQFRVYSPAAYNEPIFKIHNLVSYFERKNPEEKQNYCASEEEVG